MKIAIHPTWGGFELSPKAVEALSLVGVKTDVWGDQLDRSDPRLIEVIERLGKEAMAPGSDLKLVEIPDGTDWYLTDYDGQETIHEGRCWG